MEDRDAIIKELLYRQLQLLAEKSKRESKTTDAHEMCELTGAMVGLAVQLVSLPS